MNRYRVHGWIEARSEPWAREYDAPTAADAWFMAEKETSWHFPRVSLRTIEAVRVLDDSVIRLKCDDCKLVFEHPGPAPVVNAIDAAVRAGWFFGGCNTHLLCPKCKLDDHWYKVAQERAQAGSP